MSFLKLFFKIICFCFLILFLSALDSCKKDKLLKDSGARLEFSQDSVLFDTVFTTIGSATQNIRIRNKYSQKINISSIQLEGGSNSQFIINVDGAKGTTFTNLEIAAHDSMYIFIQVNVNPTNSNSPLIITDAIHFVLNGNEQKVVLEAWGQDAYYHRPDSALRYSDGTYFPYSVANAVPNSYDVVGSEFVWKNDKPHVVYGYLVVDEGQKLRIPEGTQIYMNYKSGIWVYAGGQIKVLGKKDKEVVFQGARREKDFADEPGQWDRIWINEGSNDNMIDYAIIKNAFIGIQCEFTGDSLYSKKRLLTLTNTKIQNMSYWGLYCLYYRVLGFNNVISNCQEHCLNILLGGTYLFSQCTFANYWGQDKPRDKPRDKPTVNINNYDDTQSIPLTLQFANSIVDGNLDNEFNLDLKPASTSTSTNGVTYTVSNCWIRTTTNISDTSHFVNVRRGTKNDVLDYTDRTNYNFEPKSTATAVKNFTGTLATQNAELFLPPMDIKGTARNTVSVTAGAYEVP